MDRCAASSPIPTPRSSCGRPTDAASHFTAARTGSGESTCTEEPRAYNVGPMATVYPFRALRPHPSKAAHVAAVPYDVVSTDEARALAEGNPLSFLRVSRAELELPPGTDPYSGAVYERAAGNFETLKKTALVLEEEPSLYFYRLRMGAHEQTGVAVCYALDEYDRGIIRKHERTRPDKEDDRTRHMLALGA